MVTYVDDYCKINGIDFSSIVNPDGIEPSGGGLGVEEVPVPGRNYASIYPKGRSPKKYRIGARSIDRDAIEAFLEAVNNAPENSEFYPFDAERFGLIASAYAALKGKKVWGDGKVFYLAEAEIICRESWLYGASAGISYVEERSLPVSSVAMVNNGHERAPISYLAASGDYFAGAPLRWNGVGWTVMAGSPIGISAYSANLAYVRAADGCIWFGADSAWSKLSNTTVSLVNVAPDGTVFALDLATGAVLRWTGSTWVNLGGTNQLGIAALSATKFWVIGYNYYVYLYDGEWLGNIDTTTVSKIAVAPDGTLFALDLATGALLKWTGSTWVNLGGTNQIGIAPRSLYECHVLAPTGNWHTWTWVGGTVYWTLRDTIIATAISVGSDGSLYVIGSSSYVENLTARIVRNPPFSETDRYITLCTKLLRDDLFEFGWKKNEVIHSWEANLTKTWADVALDVHSKVSGGLITSSVLTLDNGDYLMIPFYGPLPVAGSNGACSLELEVTALSGNGATCQVAFLTGLSDMETVVHDPLVVGNNIIYIPDVAGTGHVAIGIKAAAVGSVSLSRIKGTVKRYIASSNIPWSDPDETFYIRVESSNACAKLASLRVDHNDRYWY